MRSAWMIFRKEMLTYFVSPIAYVILLVFLLINGVTFYFYLTAFGGQIDSVLQHQFGFVPFWFLVLLIPPLVTMRSFAEERRTGTYELLVTSGVTEPVLVTAKFMAALSFFMFLWITVLILFGLLEWVGDIDWGVILAIYGGLFLLGALFTAVGILASSFTQNQLIAASVAMVMGLLIFFLHFFRYLFDVGRAELRYFDFISPYSHFQSDFSHGVFDFRYVVFYLSVAGFLLFAASKVLERRRWW